MTATIHAFRHRDRRARFSCIRNAEAARRIQQREIRYDELMKLAQDTFDRMTQNGVCDPYPPEGPGAA